MSYAEKLSMPVWQKRRLHIFQRDNWQCVRCGRDDIELQIHHRDYFPGLEPWQYPDNDLITLCKYCHSQESKREKHESMLLNSLKSTGFLAYEILAISVYLDRYEGFRNRLKKLISTFTEEEL